jgi:lipopolysaccharide transport system ATP-binding protein
MGSIIAAEGLGKKYLLHHRRDRARTTFRELLQAKARTFVRRLARPLRGRGSLPDHLEEFWALRDVSATIEQGERIGIVGSNGAGKSTLLKILSRITEPSAGRVTLRGRVASLLEVGTGFHPELTGRENIFLNGAILGMRMAEIRKNFDAIVDFAGIERFLDTPVKRYSSGMYVRLAFSIAAHLEPDILLVDEVLAVGDIQFQQKCVGKMESVSREGGRTVLFVSHNMAAVKTLCPTSMLLERGSVAARGETDGVLDTYLRGALGEPEHRGPRPNPGDRPVFCESLILTGDDARPRGVFLMGEPLTITAVVVFNGAIDNLEVGVGIKNSLGELITHLHNHDERVVISGRGGDRLAIAIRIDRLLFAPGRYRLSLGLTRLSDLYDVLDDHVTFVVHKGPRVGRAGDWPSHVTTFTETRWTVSDADGPGI